VQFATKPNLSNVLQEFAKTQLTEDLTPAALEVLSIISYCAPIMRSEIEHIRGVNCSITLRNLMVRGLIEKTENLNSQQEVSYAPTFELLRHLGVTSIDELPEYEKFKNLYQTALQGEAHETVTSAVQEKQGEQEVSEE
jgi:segregation and condensation protein B